MAAFYINDISFTTATAVFEDEAMSICAPDGFYSDGTIARQQVGCVLFPEQVCPTCCTDNCSGWEVVFVTDGGITYIECGSGLEIDLKAKIGITHQICVVRGTTPIINDGTVTLTNTIYCGCCVDSTCNTWKWVPVGGSPSVSILITNCSGIVETISFTAIESNFCILPGTTPIITAGVGYLEFVFCECGI